MKKLVSIVSFLAVFLFVTPVKAEIQEKNAVGLSVSYAEPKDLENGVGFGVSIGRHLLPYLSLQMYTQATKFVISTSISGSKIKEQKYVIEGEVWRAFSLVEYPVGALNQDLIKRLKDREQLYTRFRASQTFKELEEEVDRYEKWKNQQGQ